MIKSISRYIIAVSLIFLTLVGGCKSPNRSSSVIRVAVIPTEDAEQQLLHLEPLRDYLTQQVGKQFEFQITSDYSAAVEALRGKHVEMAWLGPFSYVLATKISDVEAIAGGIRADTGKATYNSIIVTRKDTGILTVEDLIGKTFAFIDPASTSGYLAPMVMFTKEGIDPESDFESVVYAGSHTAIELAVYNGKVDAGADSLPSYNLMVSNGEIDPNEVMIIWTSEDIPPSPIVIRKDLDADLKQEVQKALVNAPGVVSFEGQMTGYAAIADPDYDVIRDWAETLNIDLTKQK